MDLDDPSRPVLPDDCSSTLHPLAWEGIQLFNQLQYFEAHEALELAWRAEPGRVRDLYRGILQVGVGYYHLLRGNWIGARKMLARSRPWLAAFPPECRGVDVARLLEDAEAVDAALARIGPDGLALFDTRLLKPVVMRKDVDKTFHQGEHGDH